MDTSYCADYVSIGTHECIKKERDNLRARVAELEKIIKDLNEVRHRQNCKIIDDAGRVAELEAEIAAATAELTTYRNANKDFAKRVFEENARLRFELRSISNVAQRRNDDGEEK